jgi:transposase-like protein
VSPPLAIGGPWRALAEHAGSVTALAARLGVHRTTLHRWIAGDITPAPIVRAAVNAWAQRHRLETPFT